MRKVAKILNVSIEEVEGRPQPVLLVIDDGGDMHRLVIDRETAWRLRKAFGPHPLIDEYFRGGKGLQ